MLRNEGSIVLEDEKYHKAKTARNVDKRSLSSLNFRHDVSDVGGKRNLVRLRII